MKQELEDKINKATLVIDMLNAGLTVNTSTKYSIQLKEEFGKLILKVAENKSIDITNLINTISDLVPESIEELGNRLVNETRLKELLR